MNKSAEVIMPEDFNRCISSGGRVRTKQLSGNRYIHICYKGDKSYAGEVHTEKKVPSRKRARKEIKEGK